VAEAGGPPLDARVNIPEVVAEFAAVFARY